MLPPAQSPTPVSKSLPLSHQLLLSKTNLMIIVINYLRLLYTILYLERWSLSALKYPLTYTFAIWPLDHVSMYNQNSIPNRYCDFQQYTLTGKVSCIQPKHPNFVIWGLFLNEDTLLNFNLGWRRRHAFNHSTRFLPDILCPNIQDPKLK